MLLYEVVLKKKCISLAVHYNIFYIANLGYKKPCLQALLFLVEIRGYATLQILGFSYIDYHPFAVQIVIASG